MGDTVKGLLLAAAIIGAIIVIGKAVLWSWGVLRKLGQLADDLLGEPPRDGFPEGRPGLLRRVASIEAALAVVPALEERLAGVDARLAAVEAQLHPNGGGSLRDAVDRLAPPPEQRAA